MAEPLPSVDFAAVREAIVAIDGPAFRHHIGELGIALDLDQLVMYARRHADTDQLPGVGEALLRAAYGALHHGIGYGIEHAAERTCLVVWHGDELVLGVQKGRRDRPFPADGWKLGRWFGDPERNIATAAQWAADPEREKDALAIRILRRGPAPDPARHDAILATVIADPDDDAARLVYADWLLQHGDARGELIRVQCELARAEDRELREREVLLLRDHRAAILAGISAYTEGVTIARGLVDRVAIRVPELVAHGAELVARHPVRALRIIVDGAEAYARLGPLRFLDGISDLAIEVRKRQRFRGATPIGPSRLAATLFRRTRRLALACLSDDEHEWERFLHALDAPALETFGLEGVRMSARTLELIATYAPGRGLVLDHLIWVRPQALDAAFAALARRERLEKLALRNFPVPEECIRALVENPALVELSFKQVLVSDGMLRAIARSRVQRLSIGGYSLTTTAGLAHLMRTSTHLRELAIDYLTPDEDIATALVEAPPSLAVVHWPHCRLTAEQIARVRERRELRT